LPSRGLNYGITAKKELVSIEIIMPEPRQESEEEEELPDTSRQVIRENPHHSSILEKEAS
jgi:hypothetical protein